MEEKDGVGSKDAVNGIKTGLMGPFAPLGDTIFVHSMEQMLQARLWQKNSIIIV